MIRVVQQNTIFPFVHNILKKKVETFIKHPKVVLTAANNIFRHFKETNSRVLFVVRKKMKTNHGENLAYLSSIKVLSLIV